MRRKKKAKSTPEKRPLDTSTDSPQKSKIRSKVCSNLEIAKVQSRVNRPSQRRRVRILDDATCIRAEEMLDRKLIVRDAILPSETNWKSQRLTYLRKQGVDLGPK